MKKNLDGLLGAFMKELNLIQEEHDVSQEEKSESLKKFMNIINQLQDKSKIVGQHGTLNQMFIHFERSKCELKSATKDAISALNTDSIEDAKFVLNDTIIGVVNADYLGKIDVTKQTAIQCDQYERRLKPTSVLLDTTRPPLSFDNICLQHPIHPNGIVFVGTRSGKVFCVSEDGKQTRKLLNEVTTKGFVKDISLNASFAVCGTGYLEIYDVLADT
ncbi:unnamed protein product [Mytilus edulis]|uniref:Uncharacterized protein n=1 Tax=Mytilus edulis TaxID=6550 RepID=A0A8S3V3N9_MYTED|nr:unnamed protein product [Mytilus edulis]